MTTEVGPTLEEQAAHWGAWAREDASKNRGIGRDPHCDRVLELALACASKCEHRDRFADVGCGTGWVSAVVAPRFTEAWCTDLSEDAVQEARKNVPGASFTVGDFLSMPLPEPCDMVFSMEVIAHVRNQREFLRRCRLLTRTGGRLLLISQNPATWSRSRYLPAQHPHRLRRWPTMRELRAGLEHVGFRIESTRTIEPHGDQGALWWRPYAQGALRRVIGRQYAKRTFEAMGLGRTIVVQAVARDQG